MVSLISSEDFEKIVLKIEELDKDLDKLSKEIRGDEEIYVLNYSKYENKDIIQLLNDIKKVLYKE